MQSCVVSVSARSDRSPHEGDSSGNAEKQDYKLPGPITQSGSSPEHGSHMTHGSHKIQGLTGTGHLDAQGGQAHDEHSLTLRAECWCLRGNHQSPQILNLSCGLLGWNGATI